MQVLNAVILLYVDESLVEYVSTEKCIRNPWLKARSYIKKVQKLKKELS